jgi:hypothetical protein
MFWTIILLFIIGWSLFISAEYLLPERAFYMELSGGTLISLGHLIGLVMRK